MSDAILRAAYDYVATRDDHQARGPRLSDLRAAHQRLIDAVHAAGPLVDLPDQTCSACGLEHPGADCQQPDLFEVSDA